MCTVQFEDTASRKVQKADAKKLAQSEQKKKLVMQTAPKHNNTASTPHGLGVRCGLGSPGHISELNNAIAFVRLKNAIALLAFGSKMCPGRSSPHLTTRPWHVV